MITDTVLFVSKRSQRWLAAFLGLVLIHVAVASCTPEPVAPMMARIIVQH
ncbi:hypothetical protein [Asticcacaulis sp. EMRT-3]|nr:hypothetical protein [Asticcacaulis sp. EMRT-3]MDI7774448.1 hypothetical protein [Asticcacaulis sp. EMRT-3]